MRYFIATDIHGSAYWAQKVVDKFAESQANVLVLLGDIYYHGPRNPMPKDYSPKNVANILNTVADKMLVLKGNCDSEVDQYVSDFQFVGDTFVMTENGTKIYLTHGHIFNEQNLPKLSDGDVLIHGHFHSTTVNVVNNVTVIGLSSCALPKTDNVPCYAILDENQIVICDFDDGILHVIDY